MACPNHSESDKKKIEGGEKGRGGVKVK